MPLHPSIILTIVDISMHVAEITAEFPTGTFLKENLIFSISQSLGNEYKYSMKLLFLQEQTILIYSYQISSLVSFIQGMNLFCLDNLFYFMVVISCFFLFINRLPDVYSEQP